MSKSKRSRLRASSDTPRDSGAAADNSKLDIPRLIPAIILALLFARWLLPAESAADGETLWLTSLTLVVAAGWSWWNSSERGLALRVDRFDVLVWLLAAAYVFSATQVLTGVGNLRAAANMIWEWIAIAVLFSMLRRTLTSYVRNAFLTAFVALGVSIAVFGFWQHVVWYPQIRAEYQSNRARLEQIDSGTVAPEPGEYQRLLAQFNAQGVPLSGPSRDLFERRLEDSTEPMGFFALANSFAGLLAALTIVLAGSLLLVVWPNIENPDNKRRTRSIRNTAIAIGICLASVVWCLVLTKSRTAWVGTFVGLGALAAFIVLRRGSAQTARQLIIAGAVVVATTGLLGAIAALTGAVDMKVISESSKSLQYRIEYWTATAAMIADHPLTGVGPGSFQSNYLKYKLPGSSEEISDPHQMFLEVAATAGLPALLIVIGICGLIFLAVRQILRVETSTDAVSASSIYAGLTAHELADLRRTAGQIGWQSIALATLFVLGSGFALEAEASQQVLAVGAGAIVISALLWRLIPQLQNLEAFDQPIQKLIIAAACVALVVHLQGAGGFGMPAITSTLLGLCCLLIPIDDREVESSIESSEAARGRNPVIEQTRYRTWQLTAGISVASAVGCIVFSMVPSMNAGAIVRAADYEFRSALSQARRSYQLAAEIDSLSATPWLRLADLEFSQWYQTGSEEHLQRALKSIDEAIRRESTSPGLKAIPAMRCLSAPANIQSEATLQIAIDRLTAALHGYPNNAAWSAHLAEAQARRGLAAESQNSARHALELDDLNRAAGHRDKILSDELRTQTEQLPGVAPPTRPTAP